MVFSNINIFPLYEPYKKLCFPQIDSYTFCRSRHPFRWLCYLMLSLPSEGFVLVLPCFLLFLLAWCRESHRKHQWLSVQLTGKVRWGITGRLNRMEWVEKSIKRNMVHNLFIFFYQTHSTLNSTTID